MSMNLKELLDKATRRPWASRPTGMIVTGDNGNVRFIAQTVPHDREWLDEEDQASHALISHAVNILPVLLEALEAAQPEVQCHTDVYQKVSAAIRLANSLDAA